MSRKKEALDLPRKITFLRPWLWSTHSGMQMLELHCVYGVITTQMPDGHTDTHRDASRTKKGPPITCSVMCCYFYCTMGSKSFWSCIDFCTQTISRKLFKTSDLVYLPHRIHQVLKHSLTNLNKSFLFSLFICCRFFIEIFWMVSIRSFGISCLLDMASKIIKRKSRTFLVKL